MSSKGRRDRERIGALKNIHREAGAWSVRLVRAGQPYADYFSDAVYGGREKSLVAAQRFRDEVLKRAAPDTRVRRRVPKGTRSETGIVGVSVEIYEVDGREYERCVATWIDADGYPRRRRFSVGLYGMAWAIALAKAAREEGVTLARKERRARQSSEAALRLANAKPAPRKVKDPLSRTGIKMPPRRRSAPPSEPRRTR